MQINRLLGKTPPLLEMHLFYLMNNYSFIVTEDKGFQKVIDINYYTLFNSIINKPTHYNVSPIPPSRIEDAADYCFHNTDTIKLIFISIIVYKKKLFKKTNDIYFIINKVRSFNKMDPEKKLNDEQYLVYQELMNKSVNELFLEAEI